MSLGPGTRLGPYEIVSAIGAGGMGEVYRARDTRLKRDVALKILPESFAADPDRLARFQREAEVLASLNHPNIAHIHGLEESGSVHALVMELVEGEDLAQRIARGTIPLDEALPIAKQIAEALEAAHEQGIIHRDLKPANIKVTPNGVVKVLDFGLAKLTESASSGQQAAGSPLSMSPTVTSPAMTGVGVLLGTAAYMAPEQVRGKPVDRRSDIWAFGCVLYEMLTGKRAFDGDTVSDTLASVLKSEPDWRKLPEATPPAVATLLRRCVRNDYRRRLTDAGAIRIEIDDALATGVSSAVLRPRFGARRSFVVFAGIALLVLVTGVGIDVWLRSRAGNAQQPGVLRLSVPIPGGIDGDPTLAFSPDGTQLAYAAMRGGAPQVYLRSLRSDETTALSGTDGAADPFFSPDGRWIGFFAGGKLKKVSTSGGVAVTLADAGNQGGAWGPNDTIVFRNPSLLGFEEISASGGTPRRIPSPDPVLAASQPLQQPEFLPDGTAVLFASTTADTATADEKTIGVLMLKTGERKILIQGGSYPHYLGTGHLTFLRAGTLMAAPFDIGRLEVTGPPVAVIQDVRESVTGRGSFACSESGNCAYVTGGLAGAQRRVALVDRGGGSQMLPLAPQSYGHPRFSPAGDKVSFWIEQVNCNVVVYDLLRGTLTRITADGDNHLPIWAPDGKRLTFISRNLPTASSYDVVWKPVDGSGPSENLSPRPLQLGPLGWLAWAPDGQVLALVDRGDIWLLSRTGDGTPRPFFQTRFDETMPAFAPDGKWIAYVSDESGRQEVYVQRFPGPGPKYSISTDGGTEPVWARNGRELFFRNGDRVMTVPISWQPEFKAEKPRVLIASPFVVTAGRSAYDVSPDGEHFVMLKEGEREQRVSSINIVLNWTEELKRLVPAN